MKKLKKPTYKIFSFDDITLEELYQYHLDLIRVGEISESNPEWLNIAIQQYNHNNRYNVNPRKQELIEKYQFMVHLLITKTFYSGYADLPASYLKAIFGDNYSIMLLNLCHLGYFYRKVFYHPGEQVRRIEIIKKNIICRQRFDACFKNIGTDII